MTRERGGRNREKEEGGTERERERERGVKSKVAGIH